MTKSFFFIGTLILSLFLTTSGFAAEQIIAHCENPKGKSYFADTGLVQKKKAGWQDNSLNGGIFEVVLNDEILDVRFVDTSRSIKSVLAQGGRVGVLSRSDDSATIIAFYPAETIEIYTFYKDHEGQNKFIMTVVKSGPEALITQSSIFTGSCEFVDFERFPS